MKVDQQPYPKIQQSLNVTAQGKTFQQPRTLAPLTSLVPAPTDPSRYVAAQKRGLENPILPHHRITMSMKHSDYVHLCAIEQVTDDVRESFNKC
jgi:hypothetical protein